MSLMMQVFEVCPNCNGEGRVLEQVPDGRPLAYWLQCHECRGTRRVNTQNIPLAELKRLLALEVPEPPLGATI